MMTFRNLLLVLWFGTSAGSDPWCVVKYGIDGIPACPSGLPFFAAPPPPPPAPPRTPPPRTPPRPAPPPPAPPSVEITGPCKLLALPAGNGAWDCIASSNYVNDTGAENYGERVGNYGEGESCTFTGVPERPLVSVEFFARGALPDKDSYYSSYYGTGPGEGACADFSDALEVNGERFCGPNGPDGVIASGDIVWKSLNFGWPPLHPWLGWKARTLPLPLHPPSHSLSLSIPSPAPFFTPSSHARIGSSGMLGTGATRAAAVSAAISAAATRGAATAIRRDVLDGVHVFRSRVLPRRLQVPR